MKKTKIKTYVLMVSTVFPSYHWKKGSKTDFPIKIKHYDKIHTIRGNYELWQKRFEKINRGEAVLSLRIWDGLPYKSKQLEIFRYDNTHNIGLQKLKFSEQTINSEVIIDDVLVEDTPRNRFTIIIAKNDGLKWIDFLDWFKKYDLSRPMAIIHFTDFRY